MSLHRRIAAAAAFAVAAVCLIFAPVAYLSTRAKLYQEVRLELVRIVRPDLPPLQPQPRGGGNGSGAVNPPAGGNGPVGTPGNDHDGDTAPCSTSRHRAVGGVELGGPTGYLQSVCTNGRVIAPDGGTPQLPVTPRVRTVARTLTGAYYFTAEVAKTHEEIYVVADRADHKAIEAGFR